MTQQRIGMLLPIILVCSCTRVVDACDGAGVATKQLSVSGACKDGVNGAYTRQGNTESGREYFRDGDGYYLFYDPDCNGDGDTGDAQWMFTSKIPSTTATTDLDGDSDCAGFGYIKTTGPLPANAAWRQFCNSAWTDVAITIAPPTCVCEKEYTGTNCDTSTTTTTATSMTATSMTATTTTKEAATTLFCADSAAKGSASDAPQTGYNMIDATWIKYDFRAGTFLTRYGGYAFKNGGSYRQDPDPYNASVSTSKQGAWAASCASKCNADPQCSTFTIHKSGWDCTLHKAAIEQSL